MEIILFAQCAVVVNGKIILSGGTTFDYKVFQDIIEEYDPSTNSWRQLSVKLPQPLYDHCMILA